VKQVLNGQEVEVWSRITWKPKWGMIFSDIKKKVSGNCEVSQRSTMAIKGRNVFIKDLSLDGALIVDSIDDAEVCDVYLKAIIFHCYLFDYHHINIVKTGKTWRFDKEQWLDHGECRLQGHIGSRRNKNQRF